MSETTYPERGAAPQTDPPGEPLLTQRRVLLVIGALMLGMLLAALDQTIVATALPTIAGDLRGLSHLSWVVTGYLLLATVSTPLWGKLGDMYGRKFFFQAAIVIFLVGSALSGLSSSLIELIVFRALQGLGAGGLFVGAQAIIGDVVPPRDRGKYQGIFGAVFGLSSVAGPLLGGFFVQHLSWHWIFYINLPVGALALVVTSAFLPSALRRVQHVIDYIGAVVLAGGVTCLVLLTTLGGTTYPWGSLPIVLMAVLGVILLAIFVLVERRAAEPILPLHLFRNRVFSGTSAVGFIVGFSMFGAITYLPTYLQVVRGASPTGSGLELLPLMGGLLVTSIGSGILISRWGRYKIFPIAGSAIMIVGLYLFSRLGLNTTTLTISLYMVVLGLGLGCVMQVLVIVVQNAVPHSELGVATSGATFFRSIGGSFGTAIFGAIFANVLTGNLGQAVPSSARGIHPSGQRLFASSVSVGRSFRDPRLRYRLADQRSAAAPDRPWLPCCAEPAGDSGRIDCLREWRIRGASLWTSRTGGSGDGRDGSLGPDQSQTRSWVAGGGTISVEPDNPPKAATPPRLRRPLRPAVLISSVSKFPRHNGIKAIRDARICDSLSWEYGVANELRVTLEVGPKGKKVVAVAPDWPGLERGAKTGEAAIEKLESYLPRYATVAKLAGMDAEFGAITNVEVLEKYQGTGSTDFWGISFAFSSIDERDMSSTELERDLRLMNGCWTFFDDVRLRVSPEMQKGARGGGRDRDRIVRHTLGNEQDWAGKVGVRTPQGEVVTDDEGLNAYRSAYCAAIRTFHSEHKLARTWPLRFLIRHSAYHTMDHAWEMEDKDLTRAVD